MSMRLGSVDLTFDASSNNTIATTNRLMPDTEAKAASVLKLSLPKSTDGTACVEATGVPYQRMYMFNVYVECAGIPFLHARKQIPGSGQFPKGYQRSCIIQYPVQCRRINFPSQLCLVSI
jgi:hypothetical protein